MSSSEPIDLALEKPLTLLQVAFLLGLTVYKMKKLVADGDVVVHTVGGVQFFPTQQFVGIFRAEAVLAVRKLKLSQQLVNEEANQ